MIVAIIVVIVFLILRSGGGSFAAQATVTNNATGGSLSAALGSQASTPDYYNIGNPGYNAGPVATPVIVNSIPFAPAIPPSVNLAPAPVGPQPALGPTPVRTSVGVPTVFRAAPSGAGSQPKNVPPLVQPVAIRTQIKAPENAGAFWSKLPYSLQVMLKK